jgi:hypothetical protein
MSDPLYVLPLDVLLIIIKDTQRPFTLGALCCVCKSFNDSLSRENKLWNEISSYTPALDTPISTSDASNVHNADPRARLNDFHKAKHRLISNDFSVSSLEIERTAYVSGDQTRPAIDVKRPEPSPIVRFDRFIFFHSVGGTNFIVSKLHVSRSDVWLSSEIVDADLYNTSNPTIFVKSVLDGENLELLESDSVVLVGSRFLVDEHEGITYPESISVVWYDLESNDIAGRDFAELNRFGDSSSTLLVANHVHETPYIAVVCMEQIEVIGPRSPGDPGFRIGSCDLAVFDLVEQDYLAERITLTDIHPDGIKSIVFWGRFLFVEDRVDHTSCYLFSAAFSELQLQWRIKRTGFRSMLNGIVAFLEPESVVAVSLLDGSTICERTVEKGTPKFNFGRFFSCGSEIFDILDPDHPLVSLDFKNVAALHPARFIISTSSYCYILDLTSPALSFPASIPCCLITNSALSNTGAEARTILVDIPLKHFSEHISQLLHCSEDELQMARFSPSSSQSCVDASELYRTSENPF